MATTNEHETIKARWDACISGWRADYAAGRIDANELAIHEGNRRRAFQMYGMPLED